MNKITTSVVIASYMGEKYIQAQLDSIIKQTIVPDEIIVFDDGSTDTTVKICKNFQANYPEVNFKILEGQNVGYKRNFARALEEASCEIVFLCDQDDVWVPYKIELVLKTFTRHPFLNILFTDGHIVDERLNKFSLISRVMNYPKKSDTYPCRWPLIRNACVGATMCLHSRVLELALPIPSSQQHHDAWIARIGALTNEVMYMHHPLIYYRQHMHNSIGVRKTNILKLSKADVLSEIKAHICEISELIEEVKKRSHNILDDTYINELNRWNSFQSQRYNIIETRSLTSIIRCLILFNSYCIHLNGVRSMSKDILLSVK